MGPQQQQNRYRDIVSKVKGKCDVVRWLDLLGIARAVEPKKIGEESAVQAQQVQQGGCSQSLLQGGAGGGGEAVQEDEELGQGGKITETATATAAMNMQ